MNYFFSYQKAQIKRIFKILPFVAVFSIIFFTVTGLIAKLFLNNINFSSFSSSSVTSPQENGSRKISIGIIGNMDEPYMDFGINALQTMDSTKMSIELKLMNEEEAKKALFKGKISAYVIIPEGFIESIEYGRNDKQVIYVTSDGQQGFSDIIKTQIADILSALIVHSQSGIYSMQEELYRKKDYSRFDELTWDLNIKYVYWVLSRNKFADIKETGVSNGLSLQTYYFCAIVIFFLMILSLAANPFFSNRSTELYKIFYSRGVHSFSTVIAELFSYFIFMEIIFAIILIIMDFALNIDFLKIPQWKYSKNFKELFLFFIRSIPTVFMLCTLHFVLYETVDSVVSGILLQFIFSFIICYVSGCFYPIDFFPELIQKISNFIPTGAALKYSMLLITKNSTTQLLLFLAEIVIYSIIFLSLSVLLRFKKITGNKATLFRFSLKSACSHSGSNVEAGNK
ncbi:MAG: ABC transporter permease [Spirochaetales bacterium]|nr:ABC transporter permease [Spirochaetales bacterium]